MTLCTLHSNRQLVAYKTGIVTVTLVNNAVCVGGGGFLDAHCTLLLTCRGAGCDLLFSWHIIVHSGPNTSWEERRVGEAKNTTYVLLHLFKIYVYTERLQNTNKDSCIVVTPLKLFVQELQLISLQ